MNFLLHRHFATRETGSEAVGFGAMLPDLARLVDRKWRPRADVGLGSPALSAMRGGIAHHLEADAWFHRTAVFREGEKRTAAALRATMSVAGDEAPRLGLFGHITFEMCLDGAWLRHEGDVAARIARLEHDVARFGSHASSALREASPAPDSALASRIDVLWSRLAGLAVGYAEGEGVARRLDGIRRSLGLRAATDEVLHRWATALETCIADAEEALPALELEREAHRAAAATTATSGALARARREADASLFATEADVEVIGVPR